MSFHWAGNERGACGAVVSCDRLLIRPFLRDDYNLIAMPAGDQLRPSGDRLVDDEDDPRVKLDGKGIIDDIDGQEEVKMMAEIK